MLDICKPSELTDDDSIVAAVIVRFPNHPTITSCYSLRFWDDSYGPVWNYRDASGLDAIVRAQTWESAYECVIDEIADDAQCICPMKWNGHDEPAPDETRADEFCPLHGAHTKPDHDGNYGDLPEGSHYRSNGIPSSNWGNHRTAIAQTDLNGEDLSKCPDSRDDDSHYFLIVEVLGG